VALAFGLLPEDRLPQACHSSWLVPEALHAFQTVW
jgi:hypothetical protein